MVTKPFSKQEKQSVEIFHHKTVFHHIHICAKTRGRGISSDPDLLHPSIQHDIDFGN